MSQSGLLSDVTGPGANVETLTGNSGGAVGPDGSFNINVVGNNSNGINIVGSPGTNTLTASFSSSSASTFSFLNKLNIGALTPDNNYNFNIQNNTGGVVGLSVKNTNTTPAANVSILYQNQGGGDVYETYAYTSGESFSIGMDAGDSKSFKISSSPDLGTTDRFRIDQVTGAVKIYNLTPTQIVGTDGSNNLISIPTTGTGNIVRATSPTLVTPIIGAATGTSLSLSGGMTIGTGSGTSKYRLSTPDGFTQDIAPASPGGASTLTLPAATSDTLVALAFGQTLSNKTVKGNANTVSNTGVYMRAYLGATQSISDSTQTNVLWDTTQFNAGITRNTGYFTLPSTGIYAVFVQLYYQGNASGLREIDIYEGAAGVRTTLAANALQYPNTANNFFIQESSLHHITDTTNQTISVWTWNTSGSPLNLQSGAQSTYIYIYKISET